MARTKTPPTSSSTSKKEESSNKPATDGMRETVESVVVAFVLAFLFRTFEAEAFVIPTGSMAPTLMGRHKDLTCENCGFPYRVTARPEVEDDGSPKRGVWMQSCQCPNCRYTMDIGTREQQSKYPSYTEDRLLVGYFEY